jgi:hypothetical protein
MSWVFGSGFISMFNLRIRECSFLNKSSCISNNIPHFFTKVKASVMKTSEGVDLEFHHTWPWNWIELYGEPREHYYTTIGWEAGWAPARRSGRCGAEKHFLPLSRIEPQPFTPQPSLQRRSYPYGHVICMTILVDGGLDWRLAFLPVALQPNFGPWPPPRNFPFHFGY